MTNLKPCEVKEMAQKISDVGVCGYTDESVAVAEGYLDTRQREDVLVEALEVIADIKNRVIAEDDELGVVARIANEALAQHKQQREGE